MDNAMENSLPEKEQKSVLNHDFFSDEEDLNKEELDELVDYFYEEVSFPLFMDGKEEEVQQAFLQAIKQTYYTRLNTKLGFIYIAYRGNSLRFLSLEDEATFLRKARAALGITPLAATYLELPGLLCQQIQHAINEDTVFTGSLDLGDLTPWQQAVLECIRHIPRGDVHTFAEIADELGKPGSAAAIGRVVARNPFPVLIPCHRVCRTDKKLGQYASGGEAVKQRLLLLEGVRIDDFERVILKEKDELSTRARLFADLDDLLLQMHISLLPQPSQVQEPLPWQRGLAGYIRWLIERYKNISAQQAFPHLAYLDFSAVYTEPRIVFSPDQDDRSGSQPTRARGEDGLHMVVNQQAHTVLLGMPGSGKTMALRALALKYALHIQQALEDEALEMAELLVPIPLQLADYVQYGLKEGKSLHDFFLFYFRNHGCPEDGLSDLVDWLLEKGGYIALLDGLDEVQDDALQHDLVQRINQFVECTAGRTQFVVTSRLTGRYGELDSRFVPWEIVGMETQTIADFLWNWYTVTNGETLVARTNREQREQAERILREIETLQHIIKLTHSSIRDSTTLAAPSITPLLVQIAVFVYSMLIQRIHQQTEITLLIEKTLQYAKKKLPEEMIHEYLASLLAKVVYLHYSSWHRQDRLQAKDDAWQPGDERPDTAIEEVVRALCGSASKVDTALNIRQEVEDLLAFMQQRTDEFIQPTRRILPAIA